jgi:Na+-driven multidrug efflux pump
MKLAIPGMLALLVEWSNYEIGTFAAAGLDDNDLAVITIAQQMVFIAYQVKHYFSKFKTSLNYSEKIFFL